MTLPPTPLASEATPSAQLEAPGFGRSILTWLAIAATTVLVLVSGGMLLSGASPADAFGLGVFAAMWGGTGFGVMLGGVVHANRLESATLVSSRAVPTEVFATNSSTGAGQSSASGIS